MSAGSALDTITTVAGTEFRRFHARYDVPSSTNGGTATASAWTPYPLDTVVQNAVPGAALASNVITLPAGTYRVSAAIKVYNIEQFQIRLRKTDGTAATLLLGSSGFSGSTSNNRDLHG
jgi:hypothetical protein